MSIAKQFSREIQSHIQPAITEIHRRLGLNYFGIDCNIDKDMNLLIFEINANINIFGDSENSNFLKHIQKAKNELINMFTSV